MSQSQNSSHPDLWQDCRPGAIRDVVNAARQERRTRTMRQSGMITAGLVLLIGGSWSLGLFSPRGTMCGGLDCTQTATLAHQVLDGKAVTADQKSRLTLHLLGCQRCAHLRERMVPLLPGLREDAAGVSALLPASGGPVELALLRGQPLVMPPVDGDRPSGSDRDRSGLLATLLPVGGGR